MISIKFLLVISFNVYSTLKVIFRINYDTNKVNFLDILISSPRTRKLWGQDRRICSLQIFWVKAGPSTSHVFKYGEYDFPGQQQSALQRRRIKAKFTVSVGGGGYIKQYQKQRSTFQIFLSES